MDVAGAIWKLIPQAAIKEKTQELERPVNPKRGLRFSEGPVAIQCYLSTDRCHAVFPMTWLKHPPFFSFFSFGGGCEVVLLYQTRACHGMIHINAAKSQWTSCCAVLQVLMISYLWSFKNHESQTDSRWVTILMEEIHFTSQDTSQLDSSDCLRISRNVEPKLRKAHVSIEFLGESGEGATCSHWETQHLGVDLHG